MTQRALTAARSIRFQLDLRSVLIETVAGPEVRELTDVVSFIGWLSDRSRA